MLKQFRDFIFKGNVLDLAVAVIIAAAFGAVIVAFTDGIVMPLIAALVGKPDFNALAWTLHGSPIQYGRVLTALVNLVLVGGVLYLVVKAATRMRKPPPAAAPVETDHDVLVQIRDALRANREV
jgi:large conductance mechanosensitive channel